MTDCLTSEEIEDVEVSWKEIEEGKTEIFETVEEFLKDLHDKTVG